MELVLRRLVSGDEDQFVASFADQPYSYYKPGMAWEDFLRRLADVERGVELPPRHVPNTALFADVSGTLVGALRIRHELKGALQTIGGHIGYNVLQSHRRRGYGTEMLRQALPVCASLGLYQVLVTCDEDNIASRRIIEANGGAYEGKIEIGLRVPKLRYWIDTWQTL